MKTTWSPVNKDYIRVKTVGYGGALIYKNGQVLNGSWEKKTDKDKLYFYDANRKEVEFAPGNIWVEIVLKTIVFEYIHKPAYFDDI